MKILIRHPSDPRGVEFLVSGCQRQLGRRHVQLMIRRGRFSMMLLNELCSVIRVTAILVSRNWGSYPARVQLENTLTKIIAFAAAHELWLSEALRIQYVVSKKFLKFLSWKSDVEDFKKPTQTWRMCIESRSYNQYWPPSYIYIRSGDTSTRIVVAAYIPPSGNLWNISNYSTQAATSLSAVHFPFSSRKATWCTAREQQASWVTTRYISTVPYIELRHCSSWPWFITDCIYNHY